MKLITQNAERLFLETAKEHWKNYNAQRCLYLKLSHLKTTIAHWLPKVTKEIDRFFDDGNGEIYVSWDGDLFITTRFITHKNLTQLLSHLTQDILPKNFTSDQTRLFEIHIDWKILKTVFEHKIKSFEEYKIKKILAEKKAKAEATRQKILSMELDPALTYTIDFRRSERSEIEVMVAEDDVFSQKLVKAAIQKSYTAHITGDGAETITAYLKHAPDILFLDIGLPDILGHDVLKRILEIDPKAYIVMLSGNGDRENVMHALKHGAKGFVVKPFTQKKLFQYIDKAPSVKSKKEEETSIQTP